MGIKNHFVWPYYRENILILFIFLKCQILSSLYDKLYPEQKMSWLLETICIKKICKVFTRTTVTITNLIIM